MQTQRKHYEALLSFHSQEITTPHGWVNKNQSLSFVSKYCRSYLIYSNKPNCIYIHLIV